MLASYLHSETDGVRDLGGWPLLQHQRFCWSTWWFKPAEHAWEPLTGDQVAEALAQKRAEGRLETKLRLASKIDTTDHSRVQTPVVVSPIVIMRIPEPGTPLSPTFEDTSAPTSEETVHSATPKLSEETKPVPVGPVPAKNVLPGSQLDPKVLPQPLLTTLPEILDPSLALASVYAKGAVVGATEKELWRLKVAKTRPEKRLSASLVAAAKLPEWPELTPQEAQIWDLLSDPADQRTGQYRRPDRRFTLAPGKPANVYQVSNTVPDPDDF